MPKFKNSNATYWVIFKHCAKCLFIAFYDSLLIFMKYNSCTIWKWCVGICYDRWNMLTMICRFVCDDLWGEFFKYASELRRNLNDHCVIGIRCAHFFLLLFKTYLTPELHAKSSAIHTIRKVNFLSKNSILTNPQHFHEFFIPIYLVKLKLSTVKKSKTTTFSRVFHPPKSAIFSGNQSWIFGQKMKISNSV